MTLAERWAPITNPAPEGSRPADAWLFVAALDAVAIAFVVWGASLADFRAVGAAGLLPVLPGLWWAGVAMLVIAFLGAVRRGVMVPLLALQPVLLIFALYGTPALVEPFGRNPVAYVHVGLVEHVVRAGRLLENFDARYQWPGSVGLGAVLTTLTGVGSATAFLKWAPLLFAMLWSLPIWVTARSLFGHAETAATAVWIVASVNWVGQEYWSPQAVTFLLFLSFVALVLRYAPALPTSTGVVQALVGRSRTPSEARWAPAAAGPAMVVALALVAGAISVGHQLTPFVLVLSVAALVVVGRRDLGVLPLVVALLAVGWFSWGARAYWGNETNKEFLTQDMGQVTKVIREGLFARVSRGSGARTAVLVGRVVLSAAVWVSSAVVAVRWRSSRAVRTTAALLFAPVILVAAQGYGGELLLRLFLFAAPFAGVILSGPLMLALRRSGRLRLVTGAGLLLLIPAFVVCRFGNEAFEQIYPEDMAAAAYVHEHSPDGTVVVEVNPFSPFRTERNGRIPHRQILDLARPDQHDPVKLLREFGISEGYLLITTSQVAYGYYVQGGPADWSDRVVDRLSAAGVGTVVFDRGKAVVVWVKAPA